MNRMSLAWTLAAAVTLAAPGALAQGREIEAEHERGQALRQQHRDAEALDVFRRIYERTREPRALARMALAEFALGRFEVAEEHLVAALASRGDPWIERTRADLNAALQQVQTHLGWLNVVCDVDDAELWIAGRRVTSLPARQPIRIATGQVEFEVRAGGATPVHRTTEVRANETATERVSFGTGGGRTTAASPGPGGAPWVVVGVGAAALATSAAFYFGPYASAQEEFDRQCPDAQCTPQTLDAARASASDLSLYGSLSGILLGAGSTAVVTGLVWFLVDRPGRGAARPVQAVLVPVRHGVGLMVGGRF